jgi:AcrR family transcriptional regulator
MIEIVDQQKTDSCKRPYTLGKRLELSNDKRARILAAGRSLLESDGFLNLTLEALAREAGVTRQTVHNLFGTKSGVLEALFDQIALDGGMERMRFVMQQSDPELMLTSFVETFCEFWKQDRLLIRRIHGIAAIDPEFGAVVEARNRRRQHAAGRVIERLGRTESQDRAALYAMTSFEFFDSLAESCGDVEAAGREVLELVKKVYLPTV